MWMHLSVALRKDRLYVFNKPSGNIMPDDVIEQNIFPTLIQLPPHPPTPHPGPSLPSVTSDPGVLLPAVTVVVVIVVLYLASLQLFVKKKKKEKKK